MHARLRLDRQRIEQTRQLSVGQIRIVQHEGIALALFKMAFMQQHGSRGGFPEILEVGAIGEEGDIAGLSIDQRRQAGDPDSRVTDETSAQPLSQILESVRELSLFHSVSGR